MSSLDYLDLCRLCLVKDRVSVPIFEGEGDVRQIFLKIAACLPVKVTREDKLPKKICDDCVYKVELLYQFWNTTANAEKQLLQWLGEVGLEDKQSYVTGVLNPNVMKQEQNGENRLDGNAMQQVSAHQPNMGMGMMDNMGMGMPLMMSTASQQQMTSVPMDTSGNPVQSVQAVPGPSTQTTHDQMAQNQANAPPHQDEEEESSEEEENSDDDCDGDEGLPVKEESEEDPSNSRTLEPTTFVNVSLACDEPGPSGLQQQKIAEMPEMSMPQVADGDPKSGFVPLDPLAIPTCVAGYGAIDQRDPLRLTRVPKLLIKYEKEEGGTQNKTTVSGKNEKGTQNKTIKFEKEDEGLRNQAIKFEQEDEETQNMTIEFEVEEEDNQNVTIKFELEDEVTQKQTIKMEREEERRQNKTTEKKCQKKSNVAIKQYECDLCGKKYAEKSSLAAHLKQLHDCQLCCSSFLRRGELRVHMEITHGPLMYKCSKCDYKSNKKWTLKDHFTRKHTNEYRFSCKFCSKPFKIRNNLRQHVNQMHNGAPSIVCDLCGHISKNLHALRSHIKYMHEKAGFVCEVCKRRLVSQRSLDQHLHWHKTKDRIMCEQCGKSFHILYDLEVHKRTHSGVKPYICTVCSQAFAKRNTLRQHLLIHTGQRPYVCDICGKTFTQKPGLTSHRKSHPGPHPPLPNVYINSILKDLDERNKELNKI